MDDVGGGISSIMGDRYVNSDEDKKMMHKDANILYGWARSLTIPYVGINFDEDVKIKDFSNTPDDSDSG